MEDKTMQNKEQIEKDIEKILEENWGDTRCMVMGIEEYIAGNYQPKTTSTDIEELKKEFIERFGKKEKYCVACGYNECTYSTTGCPNYQEKYWTLVEKGVEHLGTVGRFDYKEEQIKPEEIWNFFEEYIKGGKSE